MQDGPFWKIMNVQLARFVPLIVASATISFVEPVRAAGTAAGTTISNTATATYSGPSGTTVTVPSNTVDLRVDEVLDVNVATVDPGDIATQPGATEQIASFTITNTGNGSEAFRLTPITAIGGDAFDPAATSIVIDSNANGSYDPAVDTPYTPGGNDPVLAPDSSVRAFVLSTIPGSATDGQRGQIDLTASALTGTGQPGTMIAGKGQGGGDAIVGASTALGRDKSFYIVAAATVRFEKTASVVDPFGGARAVPGATITYTLKAMVGGSGALNNLALADPVPAGPTYVPASLTAQGVALSDAADGDAGELATDRIAVRLGTVAAGQSRSITFKVKVN